MKEYILQEIVSEQELECFLQLRYECFCNSDAGLFITKNPNHIDLNYYDRNSNHYGLYLAGNNVKTPVGYFRIVMEGPTKADGWIQCIAQRGGLTGVCDEKPASGLPCLGIYPDTGLEKHFYTQKQRNEKTGEAGRLLIVKSERSVKLSLQLIKSALAIGVLYVQHAFVGCFREHAKAYTRLGFRQYPGSSAFFPDAAGLKKEGMLMYCRADNIPGELKTRFGIMQSQFVKNKSLTFYL